MKTVVLIVAMAALSVPADARQPTVYIHSNWYYVAHKDQEKICAVFHRKPSGAWTIVGAYRTPSEAAAIMKTASACVK